MARCKSPEARDPELIRKDIIYVYDMWLSLCIYFRLSAFSLTDGANYHHYTVLVPLTPVIVL